MVTVAEDTLRAILLIALQTLVLLTATMVNIIEVITGACFAISLVCQSQSGFSKDILSTKKIIHINFGLTSHQFYSGFGFDF